MVPMVARAAAGGAQESIKSLNKDSMRLFFFFLFYLLYFKLVRLGNGLRRRVNVQTFP
jgi:hypothetical protein